MNTISMDAEVVAMDEARCVRVEPQRVRVEPPIRAMEEPQPAKEWWAKKPYIVAVISVAFLTGVLTVSIPLIILQQNQSSSEDMAAVAMEVEEPPKIAEPDPIQEADIRALIPEVTSATIKAIQEDPYSQQSKAYDLITRDEDWETYQDWRKQQRFAVACFCYAFSTAHARYDVEPVPHQHECDWFSGFRPCTTLEDSGERVVSVLGIAANGFLDLVGTIPPEIAFLSHVERFDLVDLQVGNLEEALPRDILESFPPSLQEMKLHDCNLDGTIPSTLGLLTSLVSLDLSNNALTGSIPEEIGSLPHLTSFNVEDNEGLEASLPAGFCLEERLLTWEILNTDWCQSPSNNECCTGT